MSITLHVLSKKKTQTYIHKSQNIQTFIYTYIHTYAARSKCAVQFIVLLLLQYYFAVICCNLQFSLSLIASFASYIFAILLKLTNNLPLFITIYSLGDATCNNIFFKHFAILYLLLYVLFLNCMLFIY